MLPSEELLKKHYADLASKPFFPGLVKYMTVDQLYQWYGKV